MNNVATLEKPNLKAGTPISAIVPESPDQAWRLSTAIVRANMVPKSYEGRTPEETTSKVMIGIMKGMEVGMPPITALSNIMIVNNRPCIWGDGAIALVQKSGKLEWIEETLEGTPDSDDWTAHCKMKRVNQDKVIHQSFSLGQAKRAKLASKPGPWMQYPQRMLQMRARAWAIRDGFADCLSGLSIAEEIQDLPEEQTEVNTSFLDDDFDEHEAVQIEDQSEKKAEPDMPQEEKVLEEPADALEELLSTPPPTDQDMTPDDIFPGDIPENMSAEEYYEHQYGQQLNQN